MAGQVIYSSQVVRPPFHNGRLWHNASSLQETVVIQFPPTVRTIQWAKEIPWSGHSISADTRYITESITLPFPYVLFRLDNYIATDTNGLKLPLKTLFCGFSNKPVESDGDLIYFPPLPNILNDFRVCLGKPVKMSTIEVINKFWFSHFTEVFGVHYLGSCLFKSLDGEWQEGIDATKIKWPISTSFENFSRDAQPKVLNYHCSFLADTGYFFGPW